MQVCTSLQTDNHANTSLLSFLQAGCPSCRPTNSVKALKALQLQNNPHIIQRYTYMFIIIIIIIPCTQRRCAPGVLASDHLAVLSASMPESLWNNRKRQSRRTDLHPGSKSDARANKENDRRKRVEVKCKTVNNTTNKKYNYHPYCNSRFSSEP